MSDRFASIDVPMSIRNRVFSRSRFNSGEKLAEPLVGLQLGKEGALFPQISEQLSIKGRDSLTDYCYS